MTSEELKELHRLFIDAMPHGEWTRETIITEAGGDFCIAVHNAFPQLLALARKGKQADDTATALAILQANQADPDKAVQHA